MMLRTKFNVGDEVFHVFETESRICECGHCLGRRTIVDSSGLTACPRCGGTGRLPGAGTAAWRVTGPHVVRALHVRYEADEATTVYVMANLGNSTLFFENDLYSSRAEATTESTRRTMWIAREEARA